MPLLASAARYFDEVARQGSVRRAAERLNAAPSAVNRQIINLEAEYGVPLFERLPRGMRLTAAGELLLNEVRRWQSDHDRACRNLRALQGLHRGHAAVGLGQAVYVIVPYAHLLPDGYAGKANDAQYDTQGEP